MKNMSTETIGKYFQNGKSLTTAQRKLLNRAFKGKLPLGPEDTIDKLTEDLARLCAGSSGDYFLKSIEVDSEDPALFIVYGEAFHDSFYIETVTEAKSIVEVDGIKLVPKRTKYYENQTN